jgi:AcrR family transcriptional regulator
MADRARGRPPAGPERRDALVRAAVGQIARDGLGGLRLRSVAAEVGIDHSTIHHYFPAKQDLVAAVIDYVTGQLRTTATPAMRPTDRLHQTLRDLGRMISERPQWFALLRELDLRANGDVELAAMIAQRERGWRVALTELFQQAGPWSSRVDPAAAAELVIATVKGASLHPPSAPLVLAQLERLFNPRKGDRGVRLS